jgi:hypothetical protein
MILIQKQNKKINFIAIFKLTLLSTIEKLLKLQKTSFPLKKTKKMKKSLKFQINLKLLMKSAFMMEALLFYISILHFWETFDIHSTLIF